MLLKPNLQLNIIIKFITGLNVCTVDPKIRQDKIKLYFTLVLKTETLATKPSITNGQLLKQVPFKGL